MPSVHVRTPSPLSGCVPCCGSDLPPSPGWPRFSGRFSAGSRASAPACTPVRLMLCSGPACVSWLCQRAVSAQGTRRSSQHPPWEGWLAFSPLSPLRKGRKPSKPQPSALAGPPLLPACFLKGCRLSLQVAGAGFSKDVQGLTPQTRTAPGLGGGHRCNWIYGELGTLDGRLQGLKAQ